MNFIRRAVPQLRCVAAARSLTAGPVVSAAKGSGGEVTHTGQAYAEADYKNARFNGLKKDVNPNWAEKMIAEEPVIVSHKRVVSCDGGGGALGHPKVRYQFSSTLTRSVFRCLANTADFNSCWRHTTKQAACRPLHQAPGSTCCSSAIAVRGKA
eukprot:gene15775-23472_t